ncbi:MAG: T9SS type A sorting domain-containing protein [Bacteroidota bacterium]|nr:T9SS type A sorting domain-containing protein [Bacteroidota bacterium]
MENYYSPKTKSAFTLFCAIFFSVAVFAQNNFTWIQKAGFPGPARHRATAAAVGNRGYMGLGHVNSVFDILYDDWFEYDPGSDSWTQKANYPGGPRYHAACFTTGNKIYVGTGRNVNANLVNDFYCYNPATNSWTTLTPFPGSGRRGAIAFAINGYGYIGTGSYTTDFFRYDPVTDTWTPRAAIPGSGRTSSVAFAINGKGYVTTGDASGPSGDMWEYNPVLNSWTAKANLPGLPRMEACGFALNGLAYVGTGDNFSSGTNYQDFWSFDPATNAWTQVMDFSGSARRYMVSFVIGTRAYTALGTSGINYADLWEYGSISGVEENENGLLPMKIFPNPVHESSALQFSSSVKNANLVLTDLQGKQVARFTNVNGTGFQFERNDIPSGVYFLLLEESGKVISISKIIIG